MDRSDINEKVLEFAAGAYKAGIKAAAAMIGIMQATGVPPEEMSRTLFDLAQKVSKESLVEMGMHVIGEVKDREAGPPTPETKDTTKGFETSELERIFNLAGPPSVN